jgi:sugar transferase (PEP-CTERM system associated)
VLRIVNHYFRRQLLLQAAFDFGLVFLIVFAAAGLHGQSGNMPVSAALFESMLISACLFVITFASGFYKYPHHRTPAQSCALAIVVVVAALLPSWLLFQMLSTSPGARDVAWAGVMLGLAAVLTHRVYSAHAGARPRARTRIVIVGAGPAAEVVARTIVQADPLAEIVGFVASPNETSTIAADRLLPVRGSLAETALNLNVGEIIVALTERRGGSMPMRDLLECKVYGIRVCDISTYFEKTLAQIRLDYVNAGWLIFGDGFNQGMLRSLVKRAFDIAAALLLLVLAAPLMLLTAIAIRLESRGPVFYRQERVGFNGMTFNVVKFRSMRNDAEKDGRPQWATANDDRVTAIGRIIRLVRIDELPQLFNVLRGHMSLVGPRPERPFFVDQLTREIPYYAVRHSVKPGVTGWAQVRYQYGSTVRDSQEKLQFDLYYVKNHTLFLDLLILFETVVVVLTARGAR